MSFVFRLLALALLLAALVPWSPTRRERLVVVALDGADLSTIRSLVGEGQLPHFAALMRRSVAVSVSGASSRDPREFWRGALHVGDGSVFAYEYVWDVAADAGTRSAAVGVPETRELVSEALVVAPGADEVEGFIGDNVGRFVDRRSGGLDRVAWPYTAAVSAVRRETAGLAAGEASRWMSLRLETPNVRDGVFRLYPAGEESFYVSPVYRTARPARTYVASAPQDLLYVADDPSWSFGVPADVTPYYRHVRDLTAARFEVALRIAAEQRRLLVYFDALLALTAEAAAAAPAEHVHALHDAYRAVDERVGALARVAGPASVIAVIGRQPDDRLVADRDPERTGFVVVADAPIRLPDREIVAELPRVAPTLLRLLSLPPGGEPIADIAALFPRGDSQAALVRHAAVRDGAAVPFTPASLRALGLLSESTRAPVPEPLEEAAGSD